MKKCPACDKTFEDSMRFCQVDGTPLLDDAPAFDPYATIVAQAPIAPVVAPEPEPESEPILETPAEPEIHYTVGSIPISEPDDVLDLPSSDPLKTMYVSEAEMKATFESVEPVADIIDVPPIEEVSQPEPPSFIASEPAMPVPPPSPFAVESPSVEPAAPVFKEPLPASSPVFEEPEAVKFDEAATMIQPNFSSPFDQAPAPAPVEPWSPPPAPEASWQNQEIGSNTPFQPPPAGTEGQNKTLAIVSLVAGILGITVCCGGIIPSLVAIITGFMARGKANSNPAEFGGGGLALGGIITGVIGLLGGIVVLILWGLGMMANLANM